MNSIDKIADKLPDLHFDFYARLLPGVAGILAYLKISNGCHLEYIVAHIPLMLFLSYVIGHFFQPLSSFIVKRLEVWKGDEERVREYEFGEKSKPELLRLISKAHAEAVSMTSSWLIVAVVWVWMDLWNLDRWILGSVIALAVGSMERVYARKRKVPFTDAKKIAVEQHQLTPAVAKSFSSGSALLKALGAFCVFLFLAVYAIMVGMAGDSIDTSKALVVQFYPSDQHNEWANAEKGSDPGSAMNNSHVEDVSAALSGQELVQVVIPAWLIWLGAVGALLVSIAFLVDSRVGRVSPARRRPLNIRG